MSWPIEDIPHSDSLYFFVHHSNVEYNHEDNAVLKEAALTNTPLHGDNKSCDWSRYATPEQTRALLGRQYKTRKTEFKNPEAFFVFSHGLASWRDLHMRFRELPEQRVEHTPIEEYPEPIGSPNNRAHAIIIGDKSEMKLRVEMARCAKWEVQPPSSKQKMKVYRQELEE